MFREMDVNSAPGGVNPNPRFPLAVGCKFMKPNYSSKFQAYENLGRLQHGRGNLAGAVEYLERGLSIAEQTGKREEEARLRHRLGMALWQRGAGQDYGTAQGHFERAVSLFESIRFAGAC